MSILTVNLLFRTQVFRIAARLYVLPKLPVLPERSILLRRMAARLIDGQPGQMPPIATNVRDEAAIGLLKQWIAQLPPTANPEKKPEASAAR